MNKADGNLYTKSKLTPLPQKKKKFKQSPLMIDNHYDVDSCCERILKMQHLKDLGG